MQTNQKTEKQLASWTQAINTDKDISLSSCISQSSVHLRYLTRASRHFRKKSSHSMPKHGPGCLNREPCFENLDQRVTESVWKRKLAAHALPLLAFHHLIKCWFCSAKSIPLHYLLSNTWHMLQNSSKGLRSHCHRDKEQKHVCTYTYLYTHIPTHTLKYIITKFLLLLPKEMQPVNINVGVTYLLVGIHACTSRKNLTFFRGIVCQAR